MCACFQTLCFEPPIYAEATPGSPSAALRAFGEPPLWPPPTQLASRPAPRAIEGRSEAPTQLASRPAARAIEGHRRRALRWNVEIQLPMV
jgi:hypothetical protein